MALMLARTLVERAEMHAPISFEVEIIGDTPFGPVHNANLPRHCFHCTYQRLGEGGG